MKSSYSFEDRCTDRQMESISECTLKGLSKDMTLVATKVENQLATRKTIYLPRYTSIINLLQIQGAPGKIIQLSSHRVIILNIGSMFAFFFFLRLASLKCRTPCLVKRIFHAVKLCPQTPPIDKREIGDAAIPGERRMHTLKFFEKKYQIFGSPRCHRSCSTREDFSLDVSITNVGLISTN